MSRVFSHSQKSYHKRLYSYVAALELRIEKLERRLAFARLRKASVARHNSEAGPMIMTESARKDSLAKIRDAIHRKAARRREDSDVNSLMAEFGFLWVSALLLDGTNLADNC